ncbi:helix-turn-helix domain-containing protein [Paraburkholderia sp. GAS42]|uniref:helix-turn-helix domain-containing protein n=1 Tax=Paraburkholderia sp. GAS42 TaxID=3035135 RepID=UPI003D1E08C0
MSSQAQPFAPVGIEQFGVHSSAPGLEYCVSTSGPYLLEVTNSSDVICLLLGNINSRTRYDDGPSLPLIFRAETAAFHPKGSRMLIDAKEVRHSFIAFHYSDGFQRAVTDQEIERLRRCGSVDNIGAAAIQHLARYARQKVSASAMPDPWEIQCLATLTYIEATRHLESSKGQRKIAMSDAEFARLEEFIIGNISLNLTCGDIAAELALPIRVVVDGVKGRTGYSLYRLVLDKRIDVAATMLRETDARICDVAAECGFSSQQHMTSLFSERLGVTPLRLRKNVEANI